MENEVKYGDRIKIDDDLQCEMKKLEDSIAANVRMVESLALDCDHKRKVMWSHVYAKYPQLKDVHMKYHSEDGEIEVFFTKKEFEDDHI